MDDTTMTQAVAEAFQGWRMGTVLVRGQRAPVWYPTPDDAWLILATRWGMEAQHDRRLTR